MGEVVVGLLAVIVLGGGTAYLLTASGRRRSIGSRPVPVLAFHDEDAIAARATEYYRLVQRAVRLLESLQKDIAVSGLMSPEDRKTAQQIIDDFYA